MKKFALIMAAVATLVSSSGYAQTASGRASQSGQNAANSGFAWGVAVVGIAVVAAVAAGTGASSGGSHSSFGH